MVFGQREPAWRRNEQGRAKLQKAAHAETRRERAGLPRFGYADSPPRGWGSITYASTGAASSVWTTFTMPAMGTNALTTGYWDTLIPYVSNAIDWHVGVNNSVQAVGQNEFFKTPSRPVEPPEPVSSLRALWRD